MKIGIFSDPHGGGVGGAEYCACVLAEHFSVRHDVDLIHQSTSSVAASMAEYFGLDLSRVRFRPYAVEKTVFFFDVARMQRRKKERQWCVDLSKPYDVFINIVHSIPPFCHARYGMLYVLFPAHNVVGPESMFIGSNESSVSPWRRAISRLIDLYEWKRRFSGYKSKASISEYTQKWTRAWWGCDTEVIYPPVDERIAPGVKEKIILSIGRFSASGVSKRQDEMVRAFQAIEKKLGPEWSLYLVGGVGDQSDQREFYECVKKLALGSNVRLFPNASRSMIVSLMGKSCIYWHAAGYLDSDSDPRKAEHFGISTVEAMAAGCVPVVVSRGGQPEIVEHGGSGFLWDSIDDLKAITLSLAGNPDMLKACSVNSVGAANKFAKKRFVDEITDSLNHIGCHTE